jgi:citrate lyase beta subunit
MTVVPMADACPGGHRPPQSQFGFLAPETREDLFLRHPEAFDPTSDQQLLSFALGATLYTPATHPTLANRILTGGQTGVTSTVLCLEDAIADDQVDHAQHNLVAQLHELDQTPGPLPLIFIRPRHPVQILWLAHRLGATLALVSGFIIPKFEAAAGEIWFAAIDEISTLTPNPLYAMPVLEGSGVLYTETRRDELNATAALLDRRRDQVLAVRTGIADLSGQLGLRRSPFETIYDIAPVRDCLSDIVNTFVREGRRYVVTGGVWEYFQQEERMFRPLLRQSMFDQHTAGGAHLRGDLIDRHMDGLMSEVARDLATGLVGKTVVHPSHVRIVNALHTVTQEQWDDAEAILRATRGGASASRYGNKMNEAGPHRPWAERIRSRARAFGVLREGVSALRLLEAEETLV